MKKNKKSIIVMTIIAIVAIIGAVFAYLFIATDIFKSDKELFSKYISQSLETVEKTMDIETVQVYEKLKNENKYESNTNIEVVHSEGGEVSHYLNNLSGKIDVQKDKEQQYAYIDAQILYENEKYIEAEVIKDQNTYGIRVLDVVKKFLTLEKDEKLGIISNTLGIELELFETILNVLDSNQEDGIKNEYSDIIFKEIENGKFEKQKGIMIQTESGKVEGNSYAVSLNNQQAKTILTNIFKDIEIQEEAQIPSIKITVFESKQKTIRTLLEVGNHNITIENNDKMQTEYTNNETMQNYKIEVNKENIDNQEKVDIIIDVKNEEEEYQIILSNTMKKSDNNIEIDSQIGYKQDITTISLEIENRISIGKEFEKNESLSSNNSLLINSLEEQKITELIELFKQLVTQKINQQIEMLERKIWPTNEEIEQENNSESQVEINKFNAKFEFYTGNQVSAENVKTLLNVVKNNLKNYENINIEQQEEQDAKLNIKLNIEKSIVNENAINEINEKIIDNKKYKVEIFYKQENGIIDYITISEI